jgi:cytochrome bd-type quinol oxidase subunit 2
LTVSTRSTSGGSTSTPENDIALNFFRASVLVSDALHLRSLRHSLDPAALRLYGVLNSRLLNLFVTICCLGLLLLAAWEAPNTDADGTTAAVTMAIEAFCMVVFAAVLFCMYVVSAEGQFRHEKQHWVQLACIALTVVDLVIAIPFLAADTRYVRWSRFFRVWFLVFHVKKVYGGATFLCVCFLCLCGFGMSF